MARNHPPHVSPRNFLLGTLPLAHPCNISDTISNCAAVLETLADLFGGNEKDDGYHVLNTKGSRYGFWLLLNGIADVLERASQVATVADADTVREEVTIPLAEREFEALRATAERSGRTVEDYVGVLLREWLERFGVPESPKN